MTGKIDPIKAVKLCEALLACLEVREGRYHDPLYGWMPECPWYPLAILVDAEKIVATLESNPPSVLDKIRCQRLGCIDGQIDCEYTEGPYTVECEVCNGTGFVEQALSQHDSRSNS